MICSERLAQLRREHDYTQEQLAELIVVSRQTISKWETGAANPDILHKIHLLTVFVLCLPYISNILIFSLFDYVFLVSF